MLRKARVRTLGFGVAVLLLAACGARVDDSALRIVPNPDGLAVGSGSGAGSGGGASAAPAGEAGSAVPGADATAPAGQDPLAGPSAAGPSTPTTGGSAAAARPAGGATATTRSGPASSGAGAVTGGTAAGSGANATPQGTGTRPGPAGQYPDAVRIGGPNSQGVSDSEIKIGVLAPLSGAGGFLGELEVDAVKAFFADANARGGALGRKYRLVTADTRFEPAVEATATRRLVEQDKVFALIVPFATATSPYLASRGIPTTTFGVMPHAFSSKFPNVYTLGINMVDSNLYMAHILIDVLKQPIKTVALVYDTSNGPWEAWTEYAKKGWEYFGVQVKSIDRFNLSDGDCTQLVLKVRNLDVDFWDFAQSLGWPLCQQAMARQNWTPRLGRGGPLTDDINFAGQAGQAATGLWAMTNGVQITKNKGTPWPYDPAGKAPETDHFVETMQRYSPKSANTAGLDGIWAATFWSQAKLLHEAILRQSESITWDGVNRWIQSQKSWNGGLVSPSRHDPKCKIPAMGMWIYQYQWNGSTLEEPDWQKSGGFQTVPIEAKNFTVPGAGECYLTAMADAKL
jgi:ABC-type branched-subunit amino acid transport system substrate-binding protein